MSEFQTRKRTEANGSSNENAADIDLSKESFGTGAQKERDDFKSGQDSTSGSDGPPDLSQASFESESQKVRDDFKSESDAPRKEPDVNKLK